MAGKTYFNLNPAELISIMRSWFHAKDRSVILDLDTFLSLNAASRLEISSNEITKNRSYHEVDTESQTSSDDLDTINDGREGDILLLRQDSDDRDITLTEDGNILIPSGIDLPLGLSSDLIGLLFDGTNWLNFANPFGRMSLIAETELSADAASVTFSSIPQNYRNLLLLLQPRSDLAAEADGVSVRFNGDSGGNYDRQRIRAVDTTVSGDGVRAGTNAFITAFGEAANSRASNFSLQQTLFLGYSRTDREKWFLALGGSFGDVSADTDMAFEIEFSRWRDTSAITTMLIFPNAGSNYVSGSIFQLYGIL